MELPAIFVTDFLFLFFVLLRSCCFRLTSDGASKVPGSDVDLLEFPLNLEYLEAEFFLFGSLGFGLDKVAPSLTMRGPPPAGARKAKLDAFTRDIILQFALQEVGHLSILRTIMDTAFGRPLRPPFDPYASSLNFLIASYVIPYVGLTGYVGANPKLQGTSSKKLVAGLLGVESGEDAVIRGLLYERAAMEVKPYGIPVAELTNNISKLRNKLGKAGVKDEGLIIPHAQGAGGKITGNVLAGDIYSVSYERTPEQILRIVYGGGSESSTGGFYPEGANGGIARSHLSNQD